MEVYLARQPILVGDLALSGYEILSRLRLSRETHDAFARDHAGARSIVEAISSIGLDRMVGSYDVYLPCTRAMLVEESVTLLRGVGRGRGGRMSAHAQSAVTPIRERKTMPQTERAAPSSASSILPTRRLMNTPSALLEATPNATMDVTVVDRAAMAGAWGRGLYHIITARITISATCSVCGEPRGTPVPTRIVEDGDTATADTWHNPCGHVDRYVDVLAEARTHFRKTPLGAGAFR